MSASAIRPRMSEKTYAQSEKGVFVFIVDKSLNKHQVAELVTQTYDVEVVDVRCVVQKGKTKRLYRNRKYENGARPDMKKAYVTLKSGQSIPIFASVEEPQKKEGKK